MKRVSIGITDEAPVDGYGATWWAAQCDADRRFVERYGACSNQITVHQRRFHDGTRWLDGLHERAAVIQATYDGYMQTRQG